MNHDDHDEFEDWLRDSVQPLPPPPGTYEQVRRRARRRRLAKALSVGAVAVVVVAGGAFVPRMIRTGLPQPVNPATSSAHPVPTPLRTAPPSHPPIPHTPPPASSGAPTGGEITSTPGHSKPPAVERCHTGDLSAHLTASGAGAGQRYAGLVLTNTSSRTCTLYGYVGVALTGPDAPANTNLIRDDGPEDHLKVAPGDSAATTLHWSAIPGSGEATGCPKPSTIEVTPPDETTQLTTDWPATGVCQHGELHTVPLVKGSVPPPI